MVTAETATVLPALVAVVIGLAWLLSLGVAQVRLVDAARETARALAREEPPSHALALGRRVAPEGSAFQVRDRGGQVEVRVTAAVPPVAGLFGFLPDARLDADAVAAKEVP